MVKAEERTERWKGISLMGLISCWSMHRRQTVKGWLPCRKALSHGANLHVFHFNNRTGKFLGHRPHSPAAAPSVPQKSTLLKCNDKCPVFRGSVLKCENWKNSVEKNLMPPRVKMHHYGLTEKWQMPGLLRKNIFFLKKNITESSTGDQNLRSIPFLLFNFSNAWEATIWKCS